MERIKPEGTKVTISVWSVKDYARLHNLGEDEERRLRQLFGSFATASELRHNTRRQPKWR